MRRALPGGPRHILVRAIAAACLALALKLPSQSLSGELRLQVVDPAGAGVKAQVLIVNAASEYRAQITTGERGSLDVQRMPYGAYRIEVDAAGFAPQSSSMEIRTSLPVYLKLHLRLKAVSESITVDESSPLIDPRQSGSNDRVGAESIRDRPGTLPGRSLQDLVNEQPGWLYEGNAVLHPRGSEYQTQFVVDGIPLTDNRSPGFGPEIDADGIRSLSIFTAGIPAEFGRKMGGVVEVDTADNPQPGVHGSVALSGGSYRSATAFAAAQYTAGNNTLGASGSGSTTAHYLNPVVPQNYSNTGTLGDYAMRYERDLTPNDRLRLIARHEFSRFDIPNEQVQQGAGQRQTADNIETMAVASYEHVFSPHALGDARGMVRENANGFNSNAASTPIEVFQQNRFREGYFKADTTVDRGRHEWRFGAESDNSFLRENFRYAITDSTQFDPGTPVSFAFAGNRADLEQSGFVQDVYRLDRWTISAGLRWDHYQLLLNRQAVEPRISISHYLPAAGLLFHLSYDRVFQTPSFENILLSSSNAVEALSKQFLRLPVRPSAGDYYEAGLTGAVSARLRVDANYFRRVGDNFADDSQLEDTAISFPIAFRKSVVYGAEARVYVPTGRRYSGFLSYSYMVGNVWLPVTGGLFLGQDATAAASKLSGHLPSSQDQRNTVRGRLRYQLTPRLWLAAGARYDSGLPFEFDGSPSSVLAEYGSEVLDRLNFRRGRLDPSLLIDASAAVELYRSERLSLRLQADGENLGNVLDLIDFGGLFSGNAIGPGRSANVRLQAAF